VGIVKPSSVITEEEKRSLSNIEESVRFLVANGWRVKTDEVSERRFVNDGGTLHSLKLELRKGQLMMDGC
jgi:hypothetical protein